MRLRMLSSQIGATDELGNCTMTYEAGAVHSPPPEVAETFLRLGWAEIADGPEEAPEAAPTETKRRPGRPRK